VLPERGLENRIDRGRKVGRNHGFHHQLCPQCLHLRPQRRRFVGRQHDRRRHDPAALAQRAQQLDAVHPRHPVIQDDRVVVVAAGTEQVARGRAVRRLVETKARRAQHGGEREPDQGLILGQQHPCAAMAHRHGLGQGAPAAWCTGLVCAGPLARDVEAKGAAGTGGTFRVDAAAEGLGDMPAEPEPEPDAARRGLRRRRSALVEGLEDARQVFLRDADAVVAHGDDDLVGRTAVHLDADQAVLHVAVGVADQVVEHLPEAGRVGVHDRGTAGGDRHRHRVPGTQGRCDRLQRAGDDAVDLQSLARAVHRDARLGPRQDQQLFDQVQ